MDSYVRDILRRPPLDAEREHELAVRACGGDAAARAELIVGSLRLVAMRARLRGWRGEQLDEAVQAGTIGLIEAIDRFDPDRGTRLSTFAWHHIGAAMGWAGPSPEQLPEEGGPTVDLGPVLGDDLLTGLAADLAEVLAVRYRLGGDAGPPVPRHEVAARLGLTVSQVRTMEGRAMAQLREGLAKVVHRAPRRRGADPL